MGKIETYTQWAINIANNNEHGYSQANRTGNPDYDCSSLVSGALMEAGFNVSWMTTWTLDTTLPTLGFADVATSVNLASGVGMKRGDILLNPSAHVAIYIGNNQVVHARSSEGNSTPGDQSGNEIRVQSYWNFPWTKVYRYMAEDGTQEETTVASGTSAQISATTSTGVQSTAAQSSTAVKTMSVALPLVQPKHQNQSIQAVKTICRILNSYGLYGGAITDKYNTSLQSATKLMQAHFGLTQDAEWGTNTWQTGITKAW